MSGGGTFDGSTSPDGKEECRIEESRSHDGGEDCAVDESRGAQSGAGGGARTTGDCAGGGGHCRRDSKRRTIDLRRGGGERANGRAGCSGMSADVWDFAEAGAGVDCGKKARDYQSGGRSRSFGAAWGPALTSEEIDAARRGGRNCRERDDPVCSGGVEVCAEARRDDSGSDVKLADAGGAAGENRGCAGGGAGSVDGVDAAEGGNVAKDGVEHAEYGGDGEAGACVWKLDDRHDADE